MELMQFNTGKVRLYMKKGFALALTLVMMLCMATSAMAVSLELIREDTRKMEWIEGTDLLMVNPEGEFQTGYAYTVDGKQVSDTLMYSSSIFGGKYGYGCVTKAAEGLNHSGLLANDGTMVVPCEYGDVIIHKNWAVGVKLEKWEGEDYDYREFWDGEVHYGIVQADVYTLPEGKKVAQLTRDQYADSAAQDAYINIMDRTGVVTTYDASFAPLGQVRSLYGFTLAETDYAYYTDKDTYLDGIADKNGNKVTAAIYNGSGKVEFVDGYTKVTLAESNLVGFVNEQGVETVPCVYDEVESMFYLPVSAEREGLFEDSFGGYAIMKRDDKIGYVKLATGEETMTFVDEDDVENYGLSLEIEGDDDVVTIVTCAGVKSTYTESQYEDIDALTYTAGRLYRVEKEVDNNSKYGLIDMDGKVLLPCENSYIIKASGSGNYLLVETWDEVYQLYKVTY